MEDVVHLERRNVRVGGRTRSELKAALAAAGVRLNVSAETLLEDPVFASTEAETAEDVALVECSVGDLGLAEGVTLPQILGAAQEAGLLLCPPFAGPYLRLAMPEQPTAPDTVMSNGRAPSGSVTVASARLRPEAEYPWGFYLRVVSGEPWLRGFRCTDDAPWSPEARFAFRV